MANFTYSAKVTPYEKRREEEQLRAQQRAQEYANQSAQIYEQAIANQRAAAEQAAAQTRQQYAEQFDQNAAQQYAAERRLQEQMANYGLAQSGYNASNQAALALQRSRADAATRAARQAAVDAVMTNLQQYEAGQRQQQAKDAIARQQALEDEAENIAYNIYKTDIGLAQDERDYGLTMQKYVDSHNADIFSLMQSAYNSGNAALGNEYAKQLWQLGDDGVIRQGAFDTSGAAQFAQRVANYEMAPKAAAPSAPAPSAPKTSTTGSDREKDAFGVPTSYSSFVSTAQNMVKNYNLDGAAEIVYQIALAEAEKEAAGIEAMTEAELFRLMAAIGLTQDQFKAYVQKTYGGGQPEEKNVFQRGLDRIKNPLG